jgi:hypothetical protein
MALAGDSRFRWKTGTKPCLYGLARLSEARAAGFVVLVEGESDAQTLWYHGVPALGIPGAGSWREDRDAPHLDGIQTVYVVKEPDQGGESVLAWLTKSSIQDRVKLVDLGEHKDPSGLYLADPEKFLMNWQAAIHAAVPWSLLRAAEREAGRRQAWQHCSTLARRKRILDSFVRDAERMGVVGEHRAAQLMYLVVTSRVLDKPVSAVVKGPSSGGKSYVTDSVLRFIPDGAYYSITAMSERALAYGDEPLSHRIVVLAEAAGLSSDFASYLVRSLLSEGRIRYETVEKTKDGLRPRTIVRDGPTALLVTTTRVSLHPENETRLLSIPITDTRDQTRAVLRALAAGDRRGAVDLDPWHALQIWMSLGDNRVTIPYAAVLAEMIPAVAVRLRRDFSALLSLICAHALLHQATRKRDDEGRLIATINDYATVRELVADLIADGSGATVPATVRETVHAVMELAHEAGTSNVRLVAEYQTQIAEVTVNQVAQHLRLDKSTALRRIRVAIHAGFLKNLESRPNRPARLTSGDPMPEDVEILPSPEAVTAEVARLQSKQRGKSVPPSPSTRVSRKQRRHGHDTGPAKKAYPLADARRPHAIRRLSDEAQEVQQ